jgi:hypothetical protein
MSIVATVRDNLLALAETYAKGTGKSLSHVSKEFYGNSGFFEDLRAGTRSLSIDKLQEIVEHFQEEWPADLKIPPLRAVFMTIKR